NYDLRTLGDGCSVFSACTGNAPRAILGEDQLACASLANGDAEAAEHADHIEVGGVHDLLMAHQVLRQKKEYHGGGNDSGEGRNSQRERVPDAAIALQQVAGTAEPGQKHGDGGKIEPRGIALSMAVGVSEMHAVV